MKDQGLFELTQSIIEIAVIVVKKHFLKFIWKVCKTKVLKKTLMLFNYHYQILLNKSWMCLYKQDSEYALGTKYAKILNMAVFSTCKPYITFWICQNMPWQSSECILGFKYAKILSMTGFWICKTYTGF